MTFKSILKTIPLVAIVTSALACTAQAEPHHYPKLPPADPPCLFLMDENGNDTGNAMNPPCTESVAPAKEIDKASPMPSNRGKGSGMAKGKPKLPNR